METLKYLKTQTIISLQSQLDTRFNHLIYDLDTKGSTFDADTIVKILDETDKLSIVLDNIDDILHVRLLKH